MKVFFATDHAGFELKEALAPFVVSLGHEIVDGGAQSYEATDNYPDYIIPTARALSEAVSRGEDVRGIILGGSGQGEAIAANRMKGIRAAVYYGGSLDIVRLSREHNDANVISLGARFLTVDEAKEAVSLWLATEFSNDERHIKRIATLDI